MDVTRYWHEIKQKTNHQCPFIKQCDVICRKGSCYVVCAWILNWKHQSMTNQNTT